MNQAIEVNNQGMDNQLSHNDHHDIANEVSVKEADPLSRRVCLHSRKLAGWLDESEGNNLKNSKHFLEKHVLSCLYCSHHLQNILAIKSKIEGYIPFKIQDKMVEQSIARELAELLSRVKMDKARSSSSNRPYFLLRKLQSLLSTIIKY